VYSRTVIFTAEKTDEIDACPRGEPAGIVNMVRSRVNTDTTVLVRGFVPSKRRCRDALSDEYVRLHTRASKVLRRIGQGECQNQKFDLSRCSDTTKKLQSTKAARVLTPISFEISEQNSIPLFTDDLGITVSVNEEQFCSWLFTRHRSQICDSGSQIVPVSIRPPWSCDPLLRRHLPSECLDSMRGMLP